MRLMVVEGDIAPYRIPLLAAMRQRVEYLAVGSRFSSGIAERLTDAGVEIRHVRSIRIPRTWHHPQGFSESNPLDLPICTFATIRTTSPNVLISGDMGLRTLQALAYRSLHRDCVLIIWARLSEHSERGRSTLQIRLRRQILAGADAVIVNGASGRRYIQHLGCASEKIHTVPQVADGTFPVEHHSQASAGHIRLLFVGRLVELKGVQLLLDSLSRVDPEKFQLTIVGDGPYRRDLEAKALSMHLPIEFVGYLVGDDLAGAYSNADYLVFPTLSDEWGLVVNEALTAGVPVIGSIYSQAVQELVRDGHNGWTFSPDNLATLEQAIQRTLVVTKDEWRDLSLAARESVRFIHPESMADLFVLAAEDAVSRRRRGAGRRRRKWKEKASRMVNWRV